MSMITSVVALVNAEADTVPTTRSVGMSTKEVCTYPGWYDWLTLVAPGFGAPCGKKVMYPAPPCETVDTAAMITAICHGPAMASSPQLVADPPCAPGPDA